MVDPAIRTAYSGVNHGVTGMISDLQCNKATDWSLARVYDLVCPGKSRISGEAPDDPVTSQGNVKQTTHIGPSRFSSFQPQ